MADGAFYEREDSAIPFDCVQKHLGWRAENQVDNVLRTPQRHFDVIKEAYPHYFHQRSLDGCVIRVALFAGANY